MEESDKSAADYGSAYLAVLEDWLGSKIESKDLPFRKFTEAQNYNLLQRLTKFYNIHGLPPKEPSEHRPHIGHLQYPNLFSRSSEFAPGDEAWNSSGSRRVQQIFSDPHPALIEATKKTILVGHRVAFWDPIHMGLSQAFADAPAAGTFHGALGVVAELAPLIRHGFLVPDGYPPHPYAGIPIDDEHPYFRAMFRVLELPRLEAGAAPREHLLYDTLLRIWLLRKQRYDFILYQPHDLDSYFLTCKDLAVEIGKYHKDDLQLVSWLMASRNIEAPELSIVDIAAIRSDEELFADYRDWTARVLQLYHGDPSFKSEDLARLAEDERRRWEGRLAVALRTPGLAERLRAGGASIVMGGLSGTAAAYFDGVGSLVAGGIGLLAAGKAATEILSPPGDVSKPARRAAALNVSAFTRHTADV